MRKIHKLFAFVVFLSTAILAYFSDLKITESTTQNIITFFSVVFGFYMTCVALLYSASYSAKLYGELDPVDPTKRKIHTLKKYFSCSGNWSVLSIVTIILYSILAKSEDGVLSFSFGTIKLPLNGNFLSIDMSLISAVFGIAAVNIYFMALLLKTVLNGMVEQASDSYAQSIKAGNTP